MCNLAVEQPSNEQTVAHLFFWVTYMEVYLAFGHCSFPFPFSVILFCFCFSNKKIPVPSHSKFSHLLFVLLLYSISTYHCLVFCLYQSHRSHPGSFLFPCYCCLCKIFIDTSYEGHLYQNKSNSHFFYHSGFSKHIV